MHDHSCTGEAAVEEQRQLLFTLHADQRDADDLELGRQPALRALQSQEIRIRVCEQSDSRATVGWSV